MKNIGLLIVSLLSGFLVAELIFRWEEKHSIQQWYVYPPNQTYFFEPDSTLLTGIKGIKNFTTNSRGYRATNEFEKTTHNWLCVGGSTTECNYIDDNETWYTIFQKRLGRDFRFASVGRSGHTSKDHYHYVKTILNQDVSIEGIILMCGINDLIKYLADTSFQLDISHKESYLHLQKIGRINEAKWWGHSAFLYELKYLFPALKQKNKIDRKGSAVAKWRAHYQSRKSTLDSLPQLDNTLSIYEHNLKSIIDLCTQKKIKLVLVNQGSLWKEEMNSAEKNAIWMGGIGDYQNKKGCTYYSPCALALGNRKFNSVTERLAVENKLQFVNLAKGIPSDLSIYYDDCHFNIDGNKKVAEVLYRSFTSSTSPNNQ